MSSKLKKECFKCGYFDEKQRSFYKCAVKGFCPGSDWSKERKQQAIREE
jgi:hypothetical protein